MNKKILISISNNRKSCLLINQSIASIFNALNEEFNFSIFISFADNDIELAMDLKSKINQDAVICKTPLLKDFLILLKSMDLCFLGEGGSMHMAAALGVPQVVLFGETSINTWAPLSKSAKVIEDGSDVNNISNKLIFKTLKNKLKNLD